MSLGACNVADSDVPGQSRRRRRPVGLSVGEAQLAADRSGRGTLHGGRGIGKALNAAAYRRIKCVRMGPASHGARISPSRPARPGLVSRTLTLVASPPPPPPRNQRLPIGRDRLLTDESRGTPLLPPQTIRLYIDFSENSPLPSSSSYFGD